jgi:nucleoside-diphosphate-sugar epimerase
VRVIVLGGTWFVGRAITEALTSAGHSVLIVHRGISEPPDLPRVQHLHAERSIWPAHRAAFAAFQADAAVDVSAGNAAGAHAALSALPPGTRLVALSSVEVYRAYEAVRNGTQTDAVPLTEESPLRTGRAGRRQLPVGAGNFLFGRVYVDDVAKAVLAALTRDHGGRRCLNIVETGTAPMRLFYEQVIGATGGSLELVRVPDETLPPDLRDTGVVSQHLLASPARAVTMLGWRDTAGPQILRRAVGWHLARRTAKPDDDFSADDAALASAT